MRFPLTIIMGAWMLVVFLFSGCGGLRAASQWQGTSPLSVAEKGKGADKTASRWIVLDTGGSGGMFGLGEIRQNLMDVSFWTDGTHGFACGSAGAFATDNGGLTWRRVRERLNSPNTYYHVAMSGLREMWLGQGQHGGREGHLWYSADGGVTWSEKGAGKLSGCSGLLVNEKECWVLCGDFQGYSSRDNGETWEAINFGGLLPGTFNMVITRDVQGDRTSTIYVSGHAGQQVRLVKSFDGGRKWENVPLPAGLPPASPSYRFFFATSLKGWIGMPDGGVLYTADGGKTWERRDLPNKEQSVTALWFDHQNPEHGFAGVSNGFVQAQGSPRMGTALYETFDGGRNWITSLQGQKQVNAIFGLDSRRVWAVGDIPGFAANDLVAILAPDKKR